jgi:tRNA(Ile)-lysidine synthase
VIDRIIATIERYRMFAPGQKVAAAVSGGADSVCLLHLLVELAPRWNLQIRAVHLNHGLRDAESDADEAFVRELASQLGVPLRVERWRREEAGPANLEEAARAARLDFFRAAIAEGFADRAALGHTRSDQAETVLFRLLRGAGGAGLAGIRPVTPAGIVRPLIAVERAAVEGFLKERGLAWREDSSNRSLQFARNRLRHELLPQLAREWNPAISETLANTAEWALAEESYWETELDRMESLLAQRDGAVILETAALLALPAAAARRLVRRAMARVKGDLRGIDFKHVLAVLELAKADVGHGRLQAPGLDVIRSFSWLRLARPGADAPESRNFRLPAPVPGIVRLPAGDSSIHLELIEKTETFGPSDCVYNGVLGCINWERVSSGLEVRNWRPGDQYRPIGSSGGTKIKSLFQEARIPLWERRRWPVLTEGDSIVWSRRFGVAARYAADPGARTVLAIRESAGAGGLQR